MTAPDVAGRRRVVAAYEPQARVPITMVAGEPLAVGREDDEWPGWRWCTNRAGVSGWVPASYLHEAGAGFVAACDYDARELAVAAGAEVTVISILAGWAWCAGGDGAEGWVPLRNLGPG